MLRVSGLSLDRTLVAKFPAAENARSDSTDVGGIVRRASEIFFKITPFSPVALKKSISFLTTCSDVLSSFVAFEEDVRAEFSRSRNDF